MIFHLKMYKLLLLATAEQIYIRVCVCVCVFFFFFDKRHFRLQFEYHSNNLNSTFPLLSSLFL